MTTVLVAIPAYNTQQTILETNQSVRQQIFQDLEIIVIDDDSTNPTLESLTTFNDEKSKVYFYSNTEVLMIHNGKIDSVPDKYISFIDVKNLGNKDKLKRWLAV